MKFLSLSVDTSDIARAIDGDGDTFADLFNELVLEGPVSTQFQVDFAEALNDDGRGLLKQLLDAVVGRDAAKGR